MYINSFRLPFFPTTAQMVRSSVYLFILTVHEFLNSNILNNNISEPNAEPARTIAKYTRKREKGGG